MCINGSYLMWFSVFNLSFYSFYRWILVSSLRRRFLLDFRWSFIYCWNVYSSYSQLSVFPVISFSLTFWMWRNTSDSFIPAFVLCWIAPYLNLVFNTVSINKVLIIVREHGAFTGRAAIRETELSVVQLHLPAFQYSSVCQEEIM